MKSGLMLGVNPNAERQKEDFYATHPNALKVFLTMITKHVKKYKAEWNRKWREAHKEEYRKYNREYQRKRRAKMKVVKLNPSTA